MSRCNSTKRTLLRYKYLKLKRTPLTVIGCRKPRVRIRQDTLPEAVTPEPIASEKIIKFPQIIDIVNPLYRKSVMRCIRQLNHFASNAAKIQLDFSTVESVHSHGMLLVYAELRNIKTTFRGISITLICPENNKVLQVLKQIKLLDLLKIERDIIPTDDDVIHWRFTYGKSIDAQKLNQGVSESPLPQDVAQKLQGGMVEAVANCINHAYNYGERKPELSKVTKNVEAWWLFSHIKDERLTVLVCDLGIGIPGSLPYTVSDSIFTNIKLRLNDAGKIRFAVENRITSTNQPNRGHGLQTMTEIPKLIKGAYVDIHSNRGAYIVRADAESSGSVKYDDSINGTIIGFSLPITKA